MARDYPRGGPALYGMEMPRRAPARSSIGAVIRGFATDKDRKQFIQAREEMIGLSASRLNEIGTPRAQWASRYFKQSPRAFMSMVNQFGGMPLYEQRLRGEAASVALQKNRELPEGERMPMREVLAPIWRDPQQTEAYAGQVEQNRRAQRPRYMQDEQGVWRDPETQERAFPGVPLPPGKNALTPTQIKGNEEIATNRQFVADTMRRRGYKPTDMRRILGRVNDQWGVQSQEGLEEKALARQMAVALHRMTGDDPDYESFFQNVIGLEGLPVPVTTEKPHQYGSAIKDRHGDPDPKQMIDGMLYDLSPWPEWGMRKGRWNAETEVFEDV